MRRANTAWAGANNAKRGTVALGMVLVLLGSFVLAVNEEAQRVFSEATGLSVVSSTPALSGASPEVAPAWLYTTTTAGAVLSGQEWFMRGADNQIWGRLNRQNNMSWESLGGQLESSPATTRDGLWVFAKAGDQAIWYRQRQNSTAPWGTWTSLGGQWTSAPSVTLHSSWIYVFARGTDNRIWYRRASLGASTSWSGWATMGGGAFTSAPAAVSNVEQSALYVFGRGTDNAIYYKRTVGYDSPWDADWQGLGGVLTSGPAAGSASNDRLSVGYSAGTLAPPGWSTLYVVARGTDNMFWMRRWVHGESFFRDWENIPAGWFSGGPGMTAMDEYGNVQIWGRGLDNRIYTAIGPERFEKGVDFTKSGIRGGNGLGWSAWVAAP